MFHIIDLHFLGNQQAIASFLLETAEGPVLIETGPYSTFPHLEKGLAKHGYKVQDVKHVLLTHIHLDHAGAAWAFAEHGANIYLHPKGAGHMEDPSKLMDSARRIYQDDMERLWSDMKPIAADRLKPMEDQQVLDFGDLKLKAWFTPGHASHHIAWQWEDILFTGDVAGVCIGNGPAVPPCPPPDIDLDAWAASIALLRKLAPSSFYLTHYGQITDTEAHLKALEHNLQVYADWIKERMLAGENVADMTPDFEAFALAELEKMGVDKVGQAQYAAANPAWMSVAGLARFWKKAGLLG